MSPSALNWLAFSLLRLSSKPSSRCLFVAKNVHAAIVWGQNLHKILSNCKETHWL